MEEQVALTERAQVAGGVPAVLVERVGALALDQAEHQRVAAHHQFAGFAVIGVLAGFDVDDAMAHAGHGRAERTDQMVRNIDGRRGMRSAGFAHAECLAHVLVLGGFFRGQHVDQAAAAHVAPVARLETRVGDEGLGDVRPGHHVSGALAFHDIHQFRAELGAPDHGGAQVHDVQQRERDAAHPEERHRRIDAVVALVRVGGGQARALAQEVAVGMHDALGIGGRSRGVDDADQVGRGDVLFDLREQRCADGGLLRQVDRRRPRRHILAPHPDRAQVRRGIEGVGCSRSVQSRERFGDPLDVVVVQELIDGDDHLQIGMARGVQDFRTL